MCCNCSLECNRSEVTKEGYYSSVRCEASWCNIMIQQSGICRVRQEVVEQWFKVSRLGISLLVRANCSLHMRDLVDGSTLSQISVHLCLHPCLPTCANLLSFEPATFGKWTRWLLDKFSTCGCPSIHPFDWVLSLGREPPFLKEGWWVVQGTGIKKWYYCSTTFLCLHLVLARCVRVNNIIIVVGMIFFLAIGMGGLWVRLLYGA